MKYTYGPFEGQPLTADPLTSDDPDDVPLVEHPADLVADVLGEAYLRELLGEVVRQRRRCLRRLCRLDQEEAYVRIMWARVFPDRPLRPAPVPWNLLTERERMAAHFIAVHNGVGKRATASKAYVEYSGEALSPGAWLGRLHTLQDKGIVEHTCRVWRVIPELVEVARTPPKVRTIVRVGTLPRQRRARPSNVRGLIVAPGGLDWSDAITGSASAPTPCGCNGSASKGGRRTAVEAAPSCGCASVVPGGEAGTAPCSCKAGNVGHSARAPAGGLSNAFLHLNQKLGPNSAQALLMQAWLADGAHRPKAERSERHGFAAKTAADAAAMCGIEITEVDCPSTFGFPEPDYEFEVTDEFKEEVLGFTWDPAYSMDRILSDGDIDDMIVRWEAPSGSGAFLSTPQRSYVRWAIRLIELFRADIPNDGGFCPDAGTKIATRLLAKGYDFHVNDESWELGDCSTDPCEGGPLEIQVCAGTSIPSRLTWERGNGEHAEAAQFWCFFDSAQIKLCRANVCLGGAGVDMFMLEAARRVAYVREGNAENFVAGLYYFMQALALGRFALSVVLSLSYVLVHEMLHVEFPGTHCERNCCMQRLSTQFMCTVRARLGLYGAGVNRATDLDFSSTEFCDSVTCDEKAEVTEGLIATGCQFQRPGHQGDGSEWDRQNCLGSERWIPPVGCP